MPGLDGVFIAPNLTNVTVRNGTITNLTGRGVYVSDGCSEIYLENLSIISCQETGILFDGNPTGSGIFNGSITDCLVASCTGTNNSPSYGMRLIAVKNKNISNCIFNSNDALTTSSGYGLSIESCTNCEFQNCKFNANGGNQIGTGLNIVNSHDCTLINCQSFENISHALISSATTYGFFAESCSGILFSYCKAINNSNSVGSGIGFQSINGTNNLFDNCTAVNNFGGIFAAGFYFSSSDSNSGVTNNTAIANIASFINGISYGILLGGAQGFSLNHNTIANNLGFKGYGLLDAVTDTNNLMTENLSYNNTTTGYSVSRTTGSFPVAFATAGDFSAIANISRYMNVAIIS
jgi:hypothetical protein